MTEIRSGPTHTIFPDSGTESLPTRRWRELGSKFQFGATLGSLTISEIRGSGQSIEQEPSRLREVTGIGPKRAEWMA